MGKMLPLVENSNADLPRWRNIIGKASESSLMCSEQAMVMSVFCVRYVCFIEY